MTLSDVKERLRDLIDIHSEDERGDIYRPDVLVQRLYELELEIDRVIVLGGGK